MTKAQKIRAHLEYALIVGGTFAAGAYMIFVRW